MSMALKYGMQKRAKKAAGGECSGPDCEGCSSPKCMAKGGFVEEEEASGYEEAPEQEDEDMIGRIMKKRKMAKGGVVEPVADFESNDFDVLDKNPAPDDADYTGANSGDELGNAELDENDRDLIGRIMRSRAKRDRMPRPA